MTPCPDPAPDTPPIRFLLYYDAVYPDSHGGVEHRNHRLSRELAARGHHVVLAGWAAEWRSPEPGVEVRPIGRPRPLHGRRGTRRRLEAMRLAWQVRRLDLEGIDVVETANIPYLHVFALERRCRQAGVPLIVTWHEYWSRHWKDYMSRRRLQPGLWRLYRWLERRAAHLGDRAIAVSTMTARRLEAERGEPAPVIGNGIDVAEMRRHATSNIDAPRPAPLVFAGRLIPDKRVDLLIDAVSLLADHLVGPILTIIGDGPEANPLREQVRRLGLEEQIHMTGRLATSGEVWELAGTAQVALVPSAREGFGMFPLEALALGLPVVYCASGESAVGEVVRDGVEGLEVPADAAAIAGAVRRLLDDEDLHASLSANATRRAESFRWSDAAVQLERIALDLVRQPAQ